MAMLPLLKFLRENDYAGLRGILFLAGSVLGSQAYCQNEFPPFGQTLSYSAQIHFGSFLTDKAKEQYVKDSYSFLGEVDICKQTFGEKRWQSFNGFPQGGIGLLFGNSGSREYLGNVAAVIGFGQFALIRNSKLSLNAKLGFGPGWVEKPFNAVSNYKDFLIGSHINACIQLGLYPEFRLTPQLSFHAGLTFTHFSNGSIKVPNLGLNIPAVNFGLRFASGRTPKLRTDSLIVFRKKTHFYLWTFAAAKESYPIESATYLVNLVNFEMMRDFSNTGRYGAGINLTYDRALSKEITNSPTYAFDKSDLKLQASLYGAYEYVIGKLSIPFQLGVYLYNNYPVASLYENIGLRYRIADHWVAGVELKSHLANGDFIQWGLGYRW